VAKRLGRPRKPLPGGHKKRVPLPTEEARLKGIVRTMQTRTRKKKSSEPADATKRVVIKLKSGKTLPVLTKGHHQGRPKGAKSQIPSNVRASVKAILEDVVTKRKATIRNAIVDGLNGGPRHADRYLRLAAEYTDGKPSDTLNLNARWNQDELATAREGLGKKLDGILAVIMKKDQQ